MAPPQCGVCGGEVALVAAKHVTALLMMIKPELLTLADQSAPLPCLACVTCEARCSSAARVVTAAAAGTRARVAGYIKHTPESVASTRARSIRRARRLAAAMALSVTPVQHDDIPQDDSLQTEAGAGAGAAKRVKPASENVTYVVVPQSCVSLGTPLMLNIPVVGQQLMNSHQLMVNQQLMMNSQQLQLVESGGGQTLVLQTLANQPALTANVTNQPILPALAPKITNTRAVTTLAANKTTARSVVTTSLHNKHKEAPSSNVSVKPQPKILNLDAGSVSVNDVQSLLKRRKQPSGDWSESQRDSDPLQLYVDNIRHEVLIENDIVVEDDSDECIRVKLEDEVVTVTLEEEEPAVITPDTASSAVTRAAATTGGSDIDWEDKIPMDLISFVDAGDKAMLQ